MLYVIKIIFLTLFLILLSAIILPKIFKIDKNYFTNLNKSKNKKEQEKKRKEEIKKQINMRQFNLRNNKQLIN